MNDQAERLREKFQMFSSDKHPRTLAVVSGKGGVGKSNFSLNFSISLAKKGHSVLLFDMDIGMGNIDILAGSPSEYSIVDFFENNLPLKNIITSGPCGIDYIAGGSGLAHLVNVSEQLFEKFSSELSLLLNKYEYVIFDMGAGISEDALKFILSVDEIVVLTTPEPTSITDAYAAMKFIHFHNAILPFYLVVNRVQTEKEGKETLTRIRKVLRNFLGKESTSLGMLPDDKAVQQAVRKQIPFVIYNEKSSASKSLLEITDRYCKQQFSEIDSSNPFQFVSKLRRFLFER